MRCKLRLHYARLYAGGIVDLQSKFTVAQHHAGFVFKITIVRKNYRAGQPRPYNVYKTTNGERALHSFIGLLIIALTTRD